jgi:LmbE family N-acetylglucosaminyl deacetylase
MSIAVIVAHPDDEVLAFGGLMARHAERGDKVNLLILATGSAARGDRSAVDARAIAHLREQTQAAAKVLRVSRVEFGEFPDNRMDTVALLDVIKHVEQFLAETKAAIAYTHHARDLNIDHAVTARAVLTACRSLPGAAIQRVYAGEVVSSSEYGLAEDRFQPTSYVDVSKYIQHKCDALRCYSSEIRNWPHPRSVEAVTALARLRGSEAGLEAAEALHLLREIER